MKTQRQRILEPVDLMVATGIFATIFGVFLVLVSTQGSFQTTAYDPGLTKQTMRGQMEPAVGEALVTASVVERQHSRKIAKAVGQLNQATMTTHQLDGVTYERVREIVRQTDNARADTMARAEYVKGRSIANFTSRLQKNGLLSDPRQAEEYNRRMINIAANVGNKIARDFEKTKASHLAGAIMAEAQTQRDATRRNQEQIGAAVVKITLIEDQYRRDREATQEQLGSLISGVARVELEPSS